MFREIFLRTGTLMLLTFLALSSYILFILFLRKEMPEEDKLILKTFAAALMGISVLLLLKQFFPQFTEYTSPYGFKCIIAGNLIQLLIPVQLYYIQRVFVNFPDLRTSLAIILSALIFNALLLLFYSHIQYNETPLIFYLILVLFSLSLIIQGFKVYSSTKTYKNKRAFNYLIGGGDIFYLVAAYSLSFIFLIMTAFDANPFSREVVKFSIYIINILLTLKIVYPYSLLRLSTSGFALDVVPVRSISLNDKRLYEEKKSQELRERLVDYFENEKPYLKHNLSIKEVALHLYSNKTYLSRVINDNFNNNFNQFVNYYRVEEAKRLFGNNEELTIQKLCRLSGFGSMATFTIAFRFFLGKSPADWCKEQKIRNFNEKRGRR